MTISSTRDKGEIAEIPYPKVRLVIERRNYTNGKNVVAIEQAYKTDSLMSLSTGAGIT